MEVSTKFMKTVHDVKWYVNKNVRSITGKHAYLNEYTQSNFEKYDKEKQLTEDCEN